MGVPGPGGSRDGTGTSAYFSGRLEWPPTGREPLRRRPHELHHPEVVIATGVVTTLAARRALGSRGRDGAAALFNAGLRRRHRGAGNLFVADSSAVTRSGRSSSPPGCFRRAGLGRRWRFRPLQGPESLAADGRRNLYVNDFSSFVFTSASGRSPSSTGTVSTVIGSSTGSASPWERSRPRSARPGRRRAAHGRARDRRHRRELRP